MDGDSGGFEGVDIGEGADGSADSFVERQVRLPEAALLGSGIVERNIEMRG